MNNPYYKIIVTANWDYMDKEIHNRVKDLNEFFKNQDFESFNFEVEKLSDEEFLETE